LLNAGGAEVLENHVGELLAGHVRAPVVARAGLGDEEFIVFVQGGQAMRRDALDGEGAGDADLPVVLVGLVVEVLVFGARGDRGVDLALAGNSGLPEALVRFTRTMATLLENGVLLLPALRVVKGTIGNLVYSNAISQAETEVEQGSTLARELQESAVFPPLVVHMVGIGDESGNPEQMLAKLADYYDLEVQQTLQRLTSSIGPLVILIMGVIVGLIAVAIILPVFRASTSLAG